MKHQQIKAPSFAVVEDEGDGELNFFRTAELRERTKGRRQAILNFNGRNRPVGVFIEAYRNPETGEYYLLAEAGMTEKIGLDALEYENGNAAMGSRASFAPVVRELNRLDSEISEKCREAKRIF